MTVDQPRADAIAALLDAVERGCLGTKPPYHSHCSPTCHRFDADLLRLDADLLRAAFTPAGPACAAEATPADPTADLRAAAQRLLDRFDGPFGNSPSRDEIEALRAALAPADQTADLLQRLDKQPRWYDQRTDQDVIA